MRGAFIGVAKILRNLKAPLSDAVLHLQSPVGSIPVIFILGPSFSPTKTIGSTSFQFECYLDVRISEFTKLKSRVALKTNVTTSLSCYLDIIFPRY